LARVTKVSPSIQLSQEGGKIQTPRPSINGIIVPFEKTPEGIVCPHFYELRWAFGCPYECAYCYLRGTGRGNKRPRYRPIEKVLNALDKAFRHPYFIENPTVFNSGELADSLMNPPLMEKIVDKFEEQDRHRLLLLTKSDKVGFLVENPRRRTIVSFSLNADAVWRRWEFGTPPPEARMKAAKAVMEAGYEVRIRIDPVFPIDDWREHYEGFIYMLLSELPRAPERITLGTPRGLQKTINYSKDRSWTKWFAESSGWGRKLATPLRREIYIFFLDKLDLLGFDRSRVALCKETEAMWNALGMDKKKIRCNCIW